MDTIANENVVKSVFLSVLSKFIDAKLRSFSFSSKTTRPSFSFTFRFSIVPTSLMCMTYEQSLKQQVAFAVALSVGVE